MAPTPRPSASEPAASQLCLSDSPALLCSASSGRSEPKPLTPASCGAEARAGPVPPEPRTLTPAPVPGTNPHPLMQSPLSRKFSLKNK